MLDIYFVARKTLNCLRCGPSGPYIDGFAMTLKKDRYSCSTAVRYLRSAAHLGHFFETAGATPVP